MQMQNNENNAYLQLSCLDKQAFVTTSTRGVPLVAPWLFYRDSLDAASVRRVGGQDFI